MLLRAGVLFREMTLQNRFERLEADMCIDDRPILISACANRWEARSRSWHERNGTRDQLFFALRLAAVETSCATNEPGAHSS